jgi:pimeloyl-ACP methyl ester carboxylesterase
VLTSVLNGRIFADSYGEGGATVLALHGWGRSRSDWVDTLPGFSALAVDLPGFGLSPAPATGQGSPWYAEQLMPLVAELDRPVLVGHSFGGRVAVHIAAARPDLVGGLVLTGAPLVRLGSPRKPAAGFRFVRRLNRLGLLPDAYLDRARDKYGSADYRATEGVLRDTFVTLVNENYDPQLESISSAGYPVALVWGAEDDQAPLAVAEAIKTRVPRASLVAVAGGGHLLGHGLVGPLREAITALIPAPAPAPEAVEATPTEPRR